MGPERASEKLGQQRLAISNGVIGVVLLKRPEICQEANSLVILSGTRLLKMALGRSEPHNGTH
jgi:gamma-glutamyl phosphate reductase